MLIILFISFAFYWQSVKFVGVYYWKVNDKEVGYNLDKSIERSLI